MPKFLSVEYKNIQSVGNTPLKIDLSRNENTLIGGMNGSGKSTLGYALTYGLFGKFPSGIKLAQAINSINKKNLETKVTFTERGDEYLVVRGEKPKKFEIYKNDELLDQKASSRDQQKLLEVILGMDYNMFTQIVMLNKERFVPFMEMSAPERRKIVDGILDLSIITEMSNVCKENIKDCSTNQMNKERSITVLKTEMDGIVNLCNQINKQIESQSEEHDKEIQSLQEEIKKFEAEKESLDKALEAFDFSDQKKIKQTITSGRDMLSEFNSTINSNEKVLNFFSKNDICPTCEQDIEEKVKKEKMNESQNNIDETNSVIEELKKEIEKAEKKELQFKKMEDEMRDINSKISNISYSITQTNNALQKLNSKKEDNDLTGDLNKQIKLYEGKEEELAVLKEELEEILEQKENLEILKKMLSDDGMKSMIIDQYISVFNRKVNEYLQAMNFYINIQFDSQFNETFNSIGKENFTVENLSTGQKTRLNLSILLAFLEIASIKNSAVSNLLFCDELLENMDNEGVKDFMALCREKLSDKNIFIITQRYDEFLYMFRSSIRFKLNNNFTEIET